MVYDSNDYKSALRSALLARQETLGRTYTFQNMAKACRVQKTYLSRVFNGDAHLNDDQVYLACDYLGFTEDERTYVALLHQYERSCVQPKKRRLLHQIEVVRKKRLKAENHLKATPISADVSDYSAFYLDPYMQLVHMYLTVDKYAQEPGKIRTHLDLSEAELNRILGQLSRLGIIALQGGRYIVVKDSIHLPSDSPLYRPSLTLLRLRALGKIERAQNGDAYSFSVLFTADEEVRRRIQARFLDFLKDVEAEVKAAKADDVYQLSFDLFRWSF